MLFNSRVFIVFFILVYSLYLICRRHHKVQNVLLLVASYVFYAYWDWRYLSLLVLSTSIDFLVGKRLHATEDAGVRKLLLVLSVTANLGILGLCKYFDFFAANFARVLDLVGLGASSITLNLVLPVGISFYTFQTMTYTIDIYRRKLQPTRSLLDFAVFVSFFPQLVAGPIERAGNLLPQIACPRRIRLDQINTGVFLILWGYFKKVVVADNMGMIADLIFNNYAAYKGIDILLGTLAFAAQIYCDFSAYSDIARGLARFMGIELMVNFKLPYFALDPSDFWRRWHVSLSSWLRDYLYIPLGGSRKGGLATYRNLLLTMLLGGLWHGAAWPFVVWGAYHGAILILYRLVPGSRAGTNLEDGGSVPWKVLARMLLMFVLTMTGWLIFRSTSLEQIFQMLISVGPQMSNVTLGLVFKLLLFTSPLIAVELWQYLTRDLLIVTKLTPYLRIPLYSCLITAILVFGVRESVEFIYFQF